MKIAVIAASGKVGQLVVQEAAQRGFQVTAFSRRPIETAAEKLVVKDIFEITREDLAKFDVVVDAFGAWTPDVLDQHTTSLMHLADALAGSATRLLVVGSAGSLYLDKEHTLQLIDSPEMPADFLPLATAMSKALDQLRERTDVRWTYLSPAIDFRADGPRTGSYLLGGEELALNESGQSYVSYADYAIALVDEAEKAAHVQQRIGVYSN